MKWRRGTPAAPSVQDEADVTLSEETRRARAAAAEAGAELDRVRAVTPLIARTGQELHDLNRHNGFYSLVRRALES